MIGAPSDACMARSSLVSVRAVPISTDTTATIQEFGFDWVTSESRRSERPPRTCRRTGPVQDGRDRGVTNASADESPTGARRGRAAAESPLRGGERSPDGDRPDHLPHHRRVVHRRLIRNFVPRQPHTEPDTDAATSGWLEIVEILPGVTCCHGSTGGGTVLSCPCHADVITEPDAATSGGDSPKSPGARLLSSPDALAFRGPVHHRLDQGDWPGSPRRVSDHPKSKQESMVLALASRSVRASSSKRHSISFRIEVWL